MKRTYYLSLALLAASTVSAQEVADAYRYTKTDIVGTARYMGMAGAFGALGGDISTLSQNPAGIGIYRSSEVVATLSLGGVEANSNMPSGSVASGPDLKNGKFNINANNLGYVGTFKTGRRSGLLNFNVGFAFNRQGGEKRKYVVTQNYMKSSLSDYIAYRSNEWGGTDAGLLIDNGSNSNPYEDTNAPWLTIMGYNTGVINYDKATSSFQSLYPTLYAGGDLEVREKQRIDEYTFNVGGNFSNIVYWGLGIGVMDLNYNTENYYDEFYWEGNDPSVENGTMNYRLSNFLKTTGTGINVKGGVIIRPTNALRIGVAVHTPTWYSMTDRYYGVMQGFNQPQGTPWEMVYSPEGNFDYKLRTPWQYQFSAAYVVGKYGLLSFEYDLMDFSDIHLSEEGGYPASFQGQNDDISKNLKRMNTFKVGAEIRLSQVTSMRLGYANQASAYDDAMKNNQAQVYAAGTIPNYVVDRGTQYYTGGFGYRAGSIFADIAFVWKTNRQDAYLFPTIQNTDVQSERSRLHTTSYKFLLSLGYKF